MRLIYSTLCVAVLLLCGCNEDAGSLDTNEENNRFVKQGQAYMDMKDWGQAEQSFLQAIQGNHQMAKPHLDLATIYHQHKQDYMNAIYHYKRYLDLRPDSEKTQFIGEQIQKVQMDWAQAIFDRNGISKALQEREIAIRKLEELQAELQRLQKENTSLNSRVATLSEGRGSASTRTATTTTTEVERAAPKGDSKVYSVVEGDTLSGIAKRFYGSSSKWDVIYEANKDSMIGPGDLRIGQSLVIPAQ